MDLRQPSHRICRRREDAVAGPFAAQLARREVMRKFRGNRPVEVWNKHCPPEVGPPIPARDMERRSGSDPVE